MLGAVFPYTFPLTYHLESGWRGPLLSTTGAPLPRPQPAGWLTARGSPSHRLRFHGGFRLTSPKVHFKEVFRYVLQGSPSVALCLCFSCTPPLAQPLFTGSHEGEAHGGQGHAGRAGVEGSAVHPAAVHQHTWGERSQLLAPTAPQLAQAPRGVAHLSVSLPSWFCLVSLKKRECWRKERDLL